MALGTFLAAALSILRFGYLPPDDVLRHTAYAVGHRTWAEILVGRPEALFDQCPGWHALLRALHVLTGAGPEVLAKVAIVAGLLIVFCAGTLWVRRWEAWALALAALFLADGSLLQRISLGRPLVVTSAVVIGLLGSVRTPGLQPWVSRRTLFWIAGAALSTWIHGSWYLLFLVPAALVGARRPQEALRLACCLAAGSLVGATLTGHPLSFLWGQLAHLWSALGQPSVPRGLAMEFLPGHQSLLPLLCMAVVALAAGRERIPTPGQDAALVLAATTWLLGFAFVWRFYLDWAFPAMALWMAWRLDDLLEEAAPRGWSRVQLSALTAACFMAVVGANVGNRWAVDGSNRGLDPRKPAEAALLPGPGGILYAHTLNAFYATFFQNPDGPWRYVLGYEPGLMTHEDFQVYQAGFLRPPAQAFAPWVARMTPADRLFLESAPGTQPRIPGLIWTFTEPNKWVGRKPTEAELASLMAQSPARK